MAIENLDFLNSNSLRAFPLRQTVTRIDATGTFKIPDELVVDASLAITSDPTKRVYISKVITLNPILVLELSDEASTLIGTITVNTSTHTEYQVYNLAASVSFSGVIGKVSIGRLQALQTLPSGVFEFTLTTAEIEGRCVIPSIRGINRIVFNDQFGNLHSLSGDVKLEGRQNIRLTLDAPNNKIIMDAGEGLGLNQSCANVGVPIKTINGVGPAANGAFTLTTDDCITVVSIQNGLRIEDICSTTCAGCEEGNALTLRAIQIENQLRDLYTYYNSLLNALNTYQANVNASCVV